MSYRPKTYNHQCTVCGQWYMTYVDPKNIPGAVTPLGILNDEERKVQVFLDREFLEGRKLIGVHPNENTATVWLKTEDLLDIIKEHGNPVQVLEL